MGMVFTGLGLDQQLQRVIINKPSLTRIHKTNLDYIINCSVEKTFENMKARKKFNEEVVEDNRDFFGYFTYIEKGYCTKDDCFIHYGVIYHNDKEYRGIELLAPFNFTLDKKSNELVKNLELDRVRKSSIYCYHPIYVN